MILKSGEEIILKDRTNSVDYNDKSSFESIIQNIMARIKLP